MCLFSFSKMNLFFFVVIFCSCLNFVLCADTYRAAVVTCPERVDIGRYSSFIQNAAKSNADILVLPPLDESNPGSNYDEAVRTLSEAAETNGVYVVAHLMEKTRCQGKRELVRSNLVFDRSGAVISVYRKPLNQATNCTQFPEDITSFSTDFGVTFGVMMEEDLALRSVILKNYVVVGEWATQIPFLSASQFSASWAFANSVNLISILGVHAGKAGLVSSSDRMAFVDLKKDGSAEKTVAPVVKPSKEYPSEDLSQYVIRPLDVTASRDGYSQTVCHDSFCCQFDIKTDFVGPTQSEVSYGLGVFSGVRRLNRRQHIGAQVCAIFACAGLYKRSCSIGADNDNTNIHFEKLSISGNFTSNTSLYPLILSPSSTPLQNFKFNTEILQKSSKVTAELSYGENIFSFGIFGRDFNRDFETEFNQVNTEGLTLDVYEYLNDEDVKEFFDYVWIRVRVLLVLASVYVLEMM